MDPGGLTAEMGPSALRPFTRDVGPRDDRNLQRVRGDSFTKPTGSSPRYVNRHFACDNRRPAVQISLKGMSWEAGRL